MKKPIKTKNRFLEVIMKRMIIAVLIVLVAATEHMPLNAMKRKYEEEGRPEKKQRTEVITDSLSEQSIEWQKEQPGQEQILDEQKTDKEEVLLGADDETGCSSQEDKGVHKCTYDNCNAAFKHKHHLVNHIRTHTGEKPFKCTFKDCEYSFAQKVNLKNHIKTHTGERSFQCTYDGCGQLFARNGELKVHIRIHTGEKPFRCPYEGCNKSFTQKGNLDNHINVHTGQKPFRCQFDGCNKAFAQKNNLNRHMMLHWRKQ